MLYIPIEATVDSRSPNASHLEETYAHINCIIIKPEVNSYSAYLRLSTGIEIVQTNLFLSTKQNTLDGK